MTSNISLNQGQSYTNKQIVNIFSVGNSSGIRVSEKKSCIVLITKPQIAGKWGYKDEWLIPDKEIIYTGMGQVADQEMGLTANKFENRYSNQRLADSLDQNIPLYLFEKEKVNAYIFKGTFKLNSKKLEKKQNYSTDIEKDRAGNNRKVFKFPLIKVEEEVH